MSTEVKQNSHILGKKTMLPKKKDGLSTVWSRKKIYRPEEKLLLRKKKLFSRKNTIVSK